MLSSYQVLTDDQIQMVHEASLEVLRTTGLRLKHPVALKRLGDAGAHIDLSRERVLIPPILVEKALQRAPKQFVCAGRTPEFDLKVSADPETGPMVRSSAGGISHYDFFRNVARPITLHDCRNIAVLVDGLPNMDITACPAPPTAPSETYDLHTLKVMLASGRKHIWALPKNSRNLKYQFEMMKAVVGGSQALRQRPLCTGIVCLIEPLHFPNDEIDRLLLYGKYNLPVKVPLSPMTGANAPYTLAGALTYTNAEALGSLVLLQNLCPGIPSWYYFLIHDMEMHDGNAHYICPEVILMVSAMIQVARYYNMPSVASGFSTTDCQAHQIMFERSTALTMYALCGATELGGAGSIEGGMSMSPLALVIDDEMVGYTRHMLKGFPIDQETLAVEAINRVGHGGDFTSDPHTLKFLHRENRFKPSLFDWRPLEQWGLEGDTILERAHDKMQNILKQHEIPPLEESLQKELNHILLAAERELRAG